MFQSHETPMQRWILQSLRDIAKGPKHKIRIDDDVFCGRCLLPIAQCCCKPRGDK